MKKLLIGTANQAKVDEYKTLLKGLPLEVVGLGETGIKEIADEPETTFEENAVIKAKHYYEESGIPTLVDDGGLEIEALKQSDEKRHKWIGHEMEDEQFIKEIMKRMEGQAHRSCRLNLVLALATPFGIMTSNSAVEGVIAEKVAEKKIKGHLYRSIMYFPNYNKYYCDLTNEEHEILNHRKHAIEKIQDIFLEISK